jgi:quinol monooxygenase YgiN
MSPLYLIAEITPRPDRLDDARAALHALVESTRQEPGCDLYDLVVDSGQPGIWFMIEKWASREAWDAHMRTEHVIAHNATSDQYLSAPSQLRFFEPA